MDAADPFFGRQDEADQPYRGRGARRGGGVRRQQQLHDEHQVRRTAAGGGSSLNLVMSGTAFSPLVDTVAAGSTVTWTNQDGFLHTVTYASGPGATYDSGNIAYGGAYTHTFATAGTYGYYCKIHGTPTTGMRGTIVVQ